MKEDLMFCSMGNGITITDRNREEYCDYKTVAHISSNRDICYYDKDLSPQVVNSIGHYAKYENSSVSVTQPRPVLDIVCFSKIEVTELKKLFKTKINYFPQFRDIELEVAQFPEDQKTIIFSSQEVCSFLKGYYKYMEAEVKQQIHMWSLTIYDRANYRSSTY